MKIAEANLFTRVIVVSFAAILVFMSIRGVFGSPEMMSRIREKALSEDRSWIGSIVIGSAFMVFFCTVSVWMVVFAVKTLRAPNGKFSFVEVRFFDKFIGISATLLFFLASAVVAISWATAGAKQEVSHGWLTSVLLPSMIFGTLWLTTVVWRMFRSCNAQTGEQDGAGDSPPALS